MHPYMPACLPVCLPVCVCLLPCMLTCLPAYLPACLPACLPAYVRECVPVCLPSSLHTGTASPFILRVCMKFESCMAFCWPLVAYVCVCYSCACYHVSLKVRTNACLHARCVHVITPWE